MNENSEIQMNEKQKHRWMKNRNTDERNTEIQLNEMQNGIGWCMP